jgi:hypothetical protein
MKIAEYLTSSLIPPVSVLVRVNDVGDLEIFVPGTLVPVQVRPGVTVAIITEQVGGNHNVPLRTSVVYREPIGENRM